MSAQRFCDFCGRSEAELSTQSLNDRSELEIDGDGLWVCADCRTKIVSPPAGEMVTEDLDEEISALVGISAGAMCCALNLPYEPPYRSIIDHASELQDMYMSAWSFVTQWGNGTTVWRAPDSGAIAIATSRDGAVQIERR